MNPYSLPIVGLAALISLCAPTTAFELGSCLIVHISDASSPDLEEVIISIDETVFKKGEVIKTKESAKATDFIRSESEDSFGETKSQFSTDTTTGTFTLDEPKSAFESSPFNTSGFSFD